MKSFTCARTRSGRRLYNIDEVRAVDAKGDRARAWLVLCWCECYASGGAWVGDGVATSNCAPTSSSSADRRRDRRGAWRTKGQRRRDCSHDRSGRRRSPARRTTTRGAIEGDRGRLSRNRDRTTVGPSFSGEKHRSFGREVGHRSQGEKLRS
jgi:hypothetical protein